MQRGVWMVVEKVEVEESPEFDREEAVVLDPEDKVNIAGMWTPEP